MDRIKYITVEALNTEISSYLKCEDFFQNVFVLGEVSGFKISGLHAYFTLKDNNAAISVSDFSYRHTYVPKEGEQIIIYGAVDYYKKSGKLSLIAKEIIPYGEGFLKAQLEKLKQELKQKGYFDDSHKKPIPKFPKNVCVVTSKTGAVIKDIISTTRKYNKNIDIYVYDARVQGENADKDLIEALKTVDKLNFDVIILARGGGSFEDLMPFNSEQLVYAIYDMQTPIISAVGHETDFSLSDFVADVRALTPTAAAQLIAYDEQFYIDYFQKNEQRLYTLLSQLSLNSQSKFDILKNRLISSFNLIYSRKLNNLEKYLTKISHLANISLQNKSSEYTLKIAKISNLASNSLNKTELKLNTLIAKIDASNPTKIFTKGYMYAQKNNKQIKSINDLAKDDEITLTTQDGKAKAKILEVTNEI